MEYRVLKIGIMPRKEFEKYTLEIAQGKRKRSPNDPKVWFESVRSLAQIMSDENRQLMRTIRDQRPESIRELAQLTGRRSNNLSRTLKTLEAHGLVQLTRKNRAVKPKLRARALCVELRIA